MYAANIEPVYIDNITQQTDRDIISNHIESANINLELSPNENYKIKNLLLKYSQIFAVDPKKPGKTDVVKHSNHYYIKTY